MPNNNAEPVPAPAVPQLWHYLLAFVVLLALGLAFGELAEIARRDVPDGFDLHALHWVNRHHAEWPAFEHLFHWVTWLGDTEVAVPATVLVAVGILELGRRRVGGLRRREAAFWLSVAVSARVLCVVLKLFFQRERPPLSWHRVVIDDDSFSFPSGHSMFSAVFFTMLAIVLLRVLPRSRPRLRYLVIAGCLLMTLLVGGSRVWLGVHYPTDVAGGLLLGVAWVIIAYLIRSGWARWWLWKQSRVR